MKAVICPVCNGNGEVSSGFYSHPGDYPYWVRGATGPETCRSCGGKGWVSEKVVTQSMPDYTRCPACGGDRNSPGGSGCPMGSHYGTYCSIKSTLLQVKKNG